MPKPILFSKSEDKENMLKRLSSANYYLATKSNRTANSNKNFDFDEKFVRGDKSG